MTIAWSTVGFILQHESQNEPYRDACSPFVIEPVGVSKLQCTVISSSQGVTKATSGDVGVYVARVVLKMDR